MKITINALLFYICVLSMDVLSQEVLATTAHGGKLDDASVANKIADHKMNLRTTNGGKTGNDDSVGASKVIVDEPKNSQLEHASWMNGVWLLYSWVDSTLDGKPPSISRPHQNVPGNKYGNGKDSYDDGEDNNDTNPPSEKELYFNKPSVKL